MPATQPQLEAAPQRCGAKLAYQDVYCDREPVPGKRRCGRHGGRSTGAKTIQGMAAVAQRMKEGRERWIARMKAEGRPLPFAGFRPKGSGTPREARAQARQTRQATRENYSQAMSTVAQARRDLAAIRAAAPFASTPNVESPEWLAAIARAMLTLDAMPDHAAADGLTYAGDHGQVGLDSEILRAKLRAYRVLSPAMNALIAEGVRRAKVARFAMPSDLPRTASPRDPATSSAPVPAAAPPDIDEAPIIPAEPVLQETLSQPAPALAETPPVEHAAKPVSMLPMEPPGKPQGEGWTFDTATGYWSRPCLPGPRPEAPIQEKGLGWLRGDDFTPMRHTSLKAT